MLLGIRMRMAWLAETIAYRLRVITGGGTVRNVSLADAMYRLYKKQGRLENIHVSWVQGAGSVQRTSGIYRFFSKLFTLRTDENDVTQTTANSQPYAVNGAMVNPNGASRFMTHPTVSFGAEDAWSLSVLVDWAGVRGGYPSLVTNSGNFSRIYLSHNLGIGSYYSQSGAVIANQIDFRPIQGKKSHIVFTGNNGTLNIYINGVLKYTYTIDTSFLFLNIGSVAVSLNMAGSRYLHTVESGALTPTQILEEYNLLRSYIPEIATTLIGTDEIATENCQMVATPMGRVINLNNTAGNVERFKIDFESGLTGTKSDIAPGASTWELNTTDPISGNQDAKLTITSAGAGDSRPFIRLNGQTLISGNRYKLSFKYKVLSGIPKIKYITMPGVIATNLELNGTGLYSIHFTATGSGFLDFYFDGRTLYSCQFDDIITEEVGWNGAKELYDTLISQGSTVSNALLAAAMWRSPDSDHDKQAVFGKEYNDYAAALMRFDIEAYNTANPSTPWGYHVMTRAEEQALALLDADTLKSNALWTSTNGTNETGLSLLGSGVINADGTYSNFGTKTRLMTGEGYALDVNDDGTSAEIAVTTEGGILRLVKD